MKNAILGGIGLWCICCSVINAGNMGSSANEYNWSGFYLGANAGYWWSQHNTVNTVGSPGFSNTLFPLGTSDIANVLAVIGTNRGSSEPNGFIGGGQAGYYHQIGNHLVFGIDADIDGMTQSNGTSFINKNLPLANFSENYTSTVTIKKTIDYLGTVRGRVGFLFKPSILVYGTAGFAYGGISLNEAFRANESLGIDSYPTVTVQNNWHKSPIGWTAGGGIEWMFKSRWSTKIEYSYYDLGTQKNDIVLNQINNLGVQPVLWSSANVSSSTRFAAGTVRIGLNYHFAA